MKPGEITPTAEVLYSYGDMVAREIGGGAWFLISFSLAIAFIAFTVKELQTVNRYTPAVQAAFALILICVGSGMRGFLSWMQFMYELNGWDHRVWVQTWPWFALSVILNTIGSMWGIWIMTPAPCRIYFAIGSTIVSFGIPTILFFAL